MGKYDVDFEDYEGSTGGYDGEEPKKGIYNGKLVQFNEHVSGAGNEGLQWVFEITEGDFAGWRGWCYSNLDAAKWKTQEFTKAIQGGAEKKVTLEPGDVGDRESGQSSKTVKKAKPVRLRIINQDYEGERKGRIRNVLAADPKAADNDDAKENPGKKKKKKDEPF